LILIVLLLENNSFHLVYKSAENKVHINEYNTSFEFIEEKIYEIPSTQIKNVQLKDNTLGIGGTVHPFLSNNTITGASSMLLKVFPKEGDLAFKGTDIKIEKIRFPKIRVEEVTTCAEPLFNIFLDRVKITVKNEGPETVNELYLNFNQSGEKICNGITIQNPLTTETDFTEKFIYLNLAPNESTVLTLKDLIVKRVSPSQFEYLNLIPVCFWVSTINRSFDVNPIDNYVCERILIHHEKIPELSSPTHKFVLFPNPVRDRFRVRLLNPNLFYKRVWISNAMGETVYIKEEFDDRYLMDFEVAHFPNGIYFFNFNDGTEVYSEKFIKH